MHHQAYFHYLRLCIWILLGWNCVGGINTVQAAVPAAPVISHAIPGNAQVRLNWTAVAGATSYNIYQGTTTGGQAAAPVKTGVTGVTVVITGLTNGTTYFFKMRAVNAGGVSPLSNEKSAKPVAPPLAPVISNALPGNAQVRLNWTAVAGATSYNVYQGTTAGGQATAPVKTGVTGVTVIITGLTNGTTYFFKMRAVNAGGVSPLSNEKSAKPVVPPPAPVISNAIPGNAQVRLNWTAVAGATSYNVYQGTAAGGQATAPVKTGVTGVTVVITGLTNGTTYFFKMRAVNAGVVGPLSNEKSAKPVAPPLAPVISSAIPGNAEVSLKWDAVAGATSYNVYQGTTAGGQATAPVKTGVTGVTVVITGLTNGTTYFFKMRAVNAGGVSPLSNETSAKPVAPPLAPVISNAIPGNAQVRLNWNAVAGATSYNVYQGTTAGGQATAPVKTGVTGVTVVITGLTNGTNYFFKMRAVNAGGVSPLSNEMIAKPLLPLLLITPLIKEGVQAGLELATIAKREMSKNTIVNLWELSSFAATWNAQANGKGMTNKYVASTLINASTGEITVTFDAQNIGIAANSALVFTPYIQAGDAPIQLKTALSSGVTGTLDWGCASSTNMMSGEVYNLPVVTRASAPLLASYAPLECR